MITLLTPSLVRRPGACVQYVRSRARLVLTTFTVQDMYLNRAGVSAAMRAAIHDELTLRGVVVVNVQILSLDIPTAVRTPASLCGHHGPTHTTQHTHTHTHKHAYPTTPAAAKRD